MKTLIATLVATFAAGFQTLAAINSLPIGSVEKMLEQYILNTDEIWVNVKTIDDDGFSFLFMDSYRSYTKADGTEESIGDLCKRSVTRDRTELNALLERMMREAVRVSVDPNDPVLQGNEVQVSIGGDWQPNYTNFLHSVGTFNVENYFVLGDLKDAQGGTIIPESAYHTDMKQFISTRMKSQVIFVDNSNIIGGEVKDAYGYVVDHVIVWASTPGVIGFGNEIISGEPGTVELHYTDGTSQLFSLADGLPISAPPPPPPLKIRVEAKPYVPEIGVQTVESERLMIVEVTVTGVPPGGLGGGIIFESSVDLKYWEYAGGFSDFTGSMTASYVMSYAQMRFYRVRPALPGE